MAERAKTGPGGPTLVLFCRRPEPGTGKQRLAGALGAARTAELAALLLDCALEDAQAWPGPLVIAPARPSDADWASGLLERPACILPQPAGNLGERLNAVDRQLRAAGHQRIAYIGSDAPLLDADFYAAARAALSQPGALLALARDGGVTLMGASVPWPDLSALPWSTPALADALAACLGQAGIEVQQMDGGYDVDLPADLLALAADLAEDRRPARQRLREWLLQWERRAPAISIIIPVFHDEAALAQLLAALSALGSAEVIVVDGAGSAHCAALCQDHQAICVQTGTGRGLQLAAGAARASGEILWFLHADAEPPAGALELIRSTLADPAISAAYFRFRFRGEPTWYKRLLAALINWRTRFGVPYGDQGLFMRRSAYRAAGGFADLPLFEEVPLLRALRRQGRVVPAAASIGVASRRWEQDGWLRRSLANRGLALAYMLGASPAWLARHYRPRKGRKDE